MTSYDPKDAIRNAVRRAYSAPLGATPSRVHDLARQLNLLLQAREVARDEATECAQPH